METLSQDAAPDSYASFEPTYEGWKHLLNRGESPVVTVLSLPMRDGNYRNRQRQGFACLVLSLPMRDGNPARRRTATPRPPCFEPTYEGWKHENQNIYPSSFCQF